VSICFLSSASLLGFISNSLYFFPPCLLFILRYSVLKEFQLLLNRPVKEFLGRPRFVCVAETAVIIKEGYCEG
jgi:hypothetical protein